MSEETQYQIEVQQGAANGEVIIIYNCDDKELTPELLANTLTELSKQATEQQVFQQVSNVNEIASTQQYVLNQEPESTDAGLFELSLLEIPDVKTPVSDIDNQGIIIDNGQLENLQIENEIYFQNHVRLKKEDEISLNGMSTVLPSDSDNMEEMESKPCFVVDIDNSSKPVILSTDSTEEKDDTVAFENILPSKSTDVLIENENLTDIKDADLIFTAKEEKVEPYYLCHICSFASSQEIDVQRHLKTDHNEATPFKCNTCKKQFKLELSLQIHSLMHGGDSQSPIPNIDLGFSDKKMHKCPLCDFTFKTKIKITTHLKKDHKDVTVYRCSKCPFVCLSAEELASHESHPNHDEELKSKCPRCGISCKNIRRHFQITHSNSRPFLCTDCGFRAKTLTNLNAHTITHSKIKSVNCTQCDYCCHTKNQLDRHMMRHSSYRRFKCPYTECQFASKTKGGLQRHSQIHLVNYTCNICNYQAQGRADLKKHKLTGHPRRVSFECKECSLSFERVSELKKHCLVVHRSTKICFCAYCDFSGETQHELREHMQIHYGKYEFSCNVCGYTCRLKSLFTRHMARHNKDKKFTCSLCSYACVEKADLQKHIISKHSNVTPYCCPHCNYKCKFQSRLLNHISYVHSTVKPYFCKFCPYTGKSAENLRKHMVAHSDIGAVKTIQCVLCDYKTIEKAKLRRHMQIHIKQAVFQ